MRFSSSGFTKKHFDTGVRFAPIVGMLVPVSDWLPAILCAIAYLYCVRWSHTDDFKEFEQESAKNPRKYLPKYCSLTVVLLFSFGFLFVVLTTEWLKTPSDMIVYVGITLMIVHLLLLRYLFNRSKEELIANGVWK